MGLPLDWNLKADTVLHQYRESESKVGEKKQSSVDFAGEMIPSLS